MRLEPQARSLYTEDPVALRYLMTDTLYAVDNLPGTDTVPLQTDTAETVKQVPDLTFFGGNRSGILFISENSSAPGEHTLPEAEMAAFEKILGALQLSTEDIALMHMPVPPASSSEKARDTPAEPTRLADLLPFFKPGKIILLGTQIRIAGLENREATTEAGRVLHEVQELDAIRYIQTYSFGEMGDDVEKKRLFWNKLKELFASF